MNESTQGNVVPEKERDPLFGDLQMEGEPPAVQARRAIEHALRIIRGNYQVGYHMGLGSQAFALLTEAYAALSDANVELVRRTFLPQAKHPSDTVLVQKIREELSELHGWLSMPSARAFSEPLTRTEEFVRQVETILDMPAPGRS